MSKNNIPEPFGYFKPEPFGWTDCAETDEGAQPLWDNAALLEIEKQRDDLLEALVHIECEPINAEYIASAAIASVKGGA